MRRCDPSSFVAAMLGDVMAAGSAVFWERRACQLEAARPRAGDFRGRATDEDLRARWHALTEAAQACRNRAQVCDPDEWRGLVADVVAGVAA